MATMKSPIRTCISCRERHNQEHLYRFILDGAAVQLDRDTRGHGRGAYVCPEASCLTTAMNSDRLDKALKARISTESKKHSIMFILDK